MGIKQLLKNFCLRRQCISHTTTSSSNSIGLISGGMKMKTRSEENLKKLGESMENMDKDASKLFMKCHETDFCKHPKLLRLLSDYFTTSKRVSELCESLRKCLDREHDECHLIDEAVKDFREEQLGYGSFRKTLRDLNNFNDFFNSKESDYDILSGDFLKKTQIIHEELANLIIKLEKTMKKIDKKLRRVRGIRAIVVAALLAPVIAIMFVSKIMLGIFGFVPLEPLTTFLARMWNKSTANLKREKTAMTCMERETMVALKEVEKISRLVSRLETVERSIRITTKFVVSKLSSVSVAMTELDKEQKKLESVIVDLDREIGQCNELGDSGRNIAREQIFQCLSHGDKSSR